MPGPDIGVPLAIGYRRDRNCSFRSVSLPPSGIASLAFTARFSTAASSSARSASTGHTPPLPTISSETSSPSERRKNSASPFSTRLTSKAGRIERLLPGKRQQPLGERRGALGALHSVVQATGKLELSRLRSTIQMCKADSRLPMMIVSRLLKSCATPPVRWPMASSFCDWRKASSAADRRSIPRKDVGSPQHRKEREEKDERYRNAVNQMRRHLPISSIPLRTSQYRPSDKATSTKRRWRSAAQHDRWRSCGIDSAGGRLLDRSAKTSIVHPAGRLRRRNDRIARQNQTIVANQGVLQASVDASVEKN